VELIPSRLRPITNLDPVARHARSVPSHSLVEPKTLADGRVVIGQMDGDDVYDQGGLVGDLSYRPSNKPVWVQAPSVFTKGKVLRRMSAVELLASWDYAHGDPLDKSESRLARELFYRLASPPGRLIRILLGNILEMGRDKLGLRVEVPLEQPTTAAATPDGGPQREDDEEEIDERYLKTAKGDDAEIDNAMWKEPGETEDLTRDKETLRKYLHLCWASRIRKEGCAYLRQHPSKTNRLKVREVVERVTCGRWQHRKGWDTAKPYWEWVDGSALIFWRWPAYWRNEIRDETPIMYLRSPPRYHRPPHQQMDIPGMVEKLASKTKKLVDRRCLAPGPVTSLVPYFGVFGRCGMPAGVGCQEEWV